MQQAAFVNTINLGAPTSMSLTRLHPALILLQAAFRSMANAPMTENAQIIACVPVAALALAIARIGTGKGNHAARTRIVAQALAVAMACV
jgi:hypothetical protein